MASFRCAYGDGVIAFEYRGEDGMGAILLSGEEYVRSFLDQLRRASQDHGEEWIGEEEETGIKIFWDGEIYHVGGRRTGNYCMHFDRFLLDKLIADLETCLEFANSR